MSLTNKENVDRVMQGLPPEARAALNVMSQMQQRPPEDVLRDEIKNYIEGRLPRIDIEGAIKALQARSYQAGYIVGSPEVCPKLESGIENFKSPKKKRRRSGVFSWASV